MIGLPAGERHGSGCFIKGSFYEPAWLVQLGARLDKVLPVERARMVLSEAPDLRLVRRSVEWQVDDMAWYDDEHKLTHTETYSNAEAATSDAQKAAEAGWQASLQDLPSAANILLYVTPLAVANRQPGTVVVTYTRTPEWLEQHRHS